MQEELFIEKLEERLSPILLGQLQLERTFPKQLGEQLNTTSPECPDDLWKGLRERMTTSSEGHLSSEAKSHGNAKQTSKTTSNILPWIYKAGGLAACVALTWSLALSFNGKADNAIDPYAYISNHDFAFTGRREKLMAALHHKGFFVELKPESESYHPIKILGLDFKEGKHGTEARLVYSCCEEPVVITIQHHPQQLNTSQAQRGTAHHLSKTLDDYYIQAMSYHDPSEALALVY